MVKIVFLRNAHWKHQKKKKVPSLKEVEKKGGLQKLITRGCFFKSYDETAYQNNLPQKQNNIYVVKLLEGIRKQSSQPRPKRPTS